MRRKVKGRNWDGHDESAPPWKEGGRGCLSLDLLLGIDGGGLESLEVLAGDKGDQGEELLVLW